MNSVKNLLVCVMLMGVSYGAYQVISAPDPTLQDDQTVDVLDIQIGSRTEGASMLTPPAPDNLTNHDASPLPRSPQSTPPQNIPPLPKEFSGSLATNAAPIQKAPLKVPDLTMPELSIEPGIPPKQEFVAKSPAMQLTHPDQPAQPPKQQADISSGFSPSHTPPPLAPMNDPKALSQHSSQQVNSSHPGTPEQAANQFANSMNSQPATSGFKANGGGTFVATPQTELAPVSPKPSFSDTASNLRNQVTQEITSPYSEAANNVVESTKQNFGQAIEDVKDQFAESLVEPKRAANEILNSEQFGSRAKQLIEDTKNKTAESLDGIARKANEFVASAPLKEIITPSPPEKPQASIDWQGLNELASSGQPRQALSQLSQFYESDLPQDQRLQMLEWLDLLAGKVIYSTENLLENRPHVVREGESLEDISKAWNVPAQLIYNVNQSKIGDPSMLIPGTELKMIPGPFNAVVSLERQELTLFLDGMYAGRFPIELGQDGPGISHGSFIVEEKSPGRDYVGIDGSKIAAASTDNPYGQYWIGLNENLAIHESNPSPGQQDNRGMIRLGSRDAADVFGILSSGSNVIITR